MKVLRLRSLAVIALGAALLLSGCTQHEELPPAPPRPLRKPGEMPIPPRPPAIAPDSHSTSSTAPR